MGIVTISRTHGSGGTTFARELAHHLGYSYINRTFINNDCAESADHIRPFGIDDEMATGLHETTRELVADAHFYKVSFLANILDHVVKDNAVLSGMGAGIILTGLANTINLRVVRVMPERVRCIADVKNIPYDDAFDLVEKMDEGKREFINRYFDADVADPSLYHAVVNSSYVSLDEAVDMVANYALRHFTPTHATRAETILKMRLLEKRAEMLLFHLGMGHCYGKVVFQAAPDGSLAVSGIVRNEAEKGRLLQMLSRNSEITGIKEKLETGVFGPGA
jgi:cytidylate kinase